LFVCSYVSSQVTIRTVNSTGPSPTRHMQPEEFEKETLNDSVNFIYFLRCSSLILSVLLIYSLLSLSLLFLFPVLFCKQVAA
jgi:hypothetical protein